MFVGKYVDFKQTRRVEEFMGGRLERWVEGWRDKHKFHISFLKR